MQELTLYFDGACHLCSREIAHYQKKDQKGQIQFVDISNPSFNASKEGLDPVEVNKVLHVRLPNGEWKIGIDAFIAIWKTIPAYNWLARLATQPLFNMLLSVGYQVFAKVRPLLPKRQSAQCSTDACLR